MNITINININYHNNKHNNNHNNSNDYSTLHILASAKTTPVLREAMLCMIESRHFAASDCSKHVPRRVCGHCLLKTICDYSCSFFVGAATQGVAEGECRSSRQRGGGLLLGGKLLYYTVLYYTILYYTMGTFFVI